LQQGDPVNEAYYYFYQSMMILSLLASLFVMVLTFQHRKANGAKAMIALAAATFVWTLGFLLEANSSTLEQQLFFNNVGYIGSMSVPVAWFIFALHYTRDNLVVTGWRILPLCIVPLVIVALVWSNDLHHLMWFNEHLSTSGSFTITVKNYGPFFWIGLVYNYALIVTGAVILIRRLFVGAPLYTRQAVSLIVAVSLPLIWNFIYVFDLTPLPRKDLTPVMFAISGIAITLGLMRFQLFRIVPFARRFLVQQLRDGILIFDTSNRLLEANPAALKITGLEKNKIGKEIEYLQSLSPVLKRLSSIESGSVELPLTISGEEHIYELETMPMHDNHNQLVGWMVILHEITERKKMQEQLITQDRLASIGELTSGVAHELNNPLSIISGYSELLLKRELPADIKSDVDVIISEVERAAKIVDNLLTFARQQPEEKLHIDINGIIENILEIRAYEQKVNNIRTVTNYASDLPNILGNAFQLRQVFVNIIINAEYFMIEKHGKGTLTISTERAGDFVRVSIKDDGPGIIQENMGRLFNPFFTTKEVGKGTGLGLSICHGIIVEHGGKIWAESTQGKGAIFISELPVHEKPMRGSE
jgi:PAS domain S-box-containing protein